jgi:hypothetical protein
MHETKHESEVTQVEEWCCMILRGWSHGDRCSFEEPESPLVEYRGEFG